jgi:hypothetical protein
MVSVCYSLTEETMEAKVEWFASRSISERLEALSEMFELAVQLNPGLQAGIDDRPTSATIQVLEFPRG